MTSLTMVPAGISAGKRAIAGTRKPPSQLVVFSLLNQVTPASGQVAAMHAVVRGEDHDGVLRDAEIIQLLEERPDLIVEFEHAIGVEVEAGSPQVLLPHVGPEVHARGIEPGEPGFARGMLPVDEVHGGGQELVIHGFHPLLGEGAGVLDAPVGE